MLLINSNIFVYKLIVILYTRAIYIDSRTRAQVI
nr:MAG TPA: hypothetical protein [Caudoviricetes sp.]